jgi:hypothetical protein
MPSKKDKDELGHRQQARLDDLIAISHISAITDTDISLFCQRQLQELCAHLGLDVRGKVEALSRRLCELRDGKPSPTPMEERKQPALLLPPTSPLMYAAATAGAKSTVPDGTVLAPTTASPRTIAAVQEVDMLEDNSSLAVDNSFIEGDSQDLPGTNATAHSAPLISPIVSNKSSFLRCSPPMSPTLSSDLFERRADNMPLIGIIRQELHPTATTDQMWRPPSEILQRPFNRWLLRSPLSFSLLKLSRIL